MVDKKFTQNNAYMFTVPGAHRCSCKLKIKLQNKATHKNYWITHSEPTVCII